jgi:hypothetical protein
MCVAAVGAGVLLLLLLLHEASDILTWMRLYIRLL